MKNLSELNLAPGEIVFLDRIEEGIATLLLGSEGEREENVPHDQLPPGAREGDRLRQQADGRLAVDAEATEAGRAAVADLMAELLGAAPDATEPASDHHEEPEGERRLEYPNKSGPGSASSHKPRAGA